MTLSNKFKTFTNIDTVHGICGECEEDTILVAIVSEYYRCTNCGADTRQHVNGKISYIPHISSTTLTSEIEKFFDGKES